MDVSENGEFSPQFIHFNRVFHYKPSISGYLYFWKHPYTSLTSQQLQPKSKAKDGQQKMAPLTEVRESTQMKDFVEILCPM